MICTLNPRLFRNALAGSLLAGSLLPGLPLYAQQITSVPAATGQAVEPAYLEIAGVGKRLESSPAFVKASSSDATLSDKIKALEDKRVLQALAEARHWIGSSPVPLSPIPPETAEETVPYLQFRETAKAFAIESYVLLSEGRVREALTTTDEGLRLARPLYRQNLIGGMVGLALEAIAIRPLGRNLASVSLKEVEPLQKIAALWLSENVTLIPLLERERQTALALLNRSAAEALLPAPVLPKRQENDAYLAAIQEDRAALGKELKAQSETARQASLHAAEVHLNLFFARLKENSEAPYAQQIEAWSKLTPVSSAKTVLERQVLEREHSVSGGVNALVRRKAWGRLLATHAALIKFRWENGKLPASLEELKLGNFATDPYTEMPLLYKPTGKTYTLQSAGELLLDAAGKPDLEGRKPLSLTASRPDPMPSAKPAP